MGLESDVFFWLHVRGPITGGLISGWAYKRQFTVVCFSSLSGRESPNALRASLIRQWLHAREELYPLLLQAVIYGFLENFQKKEPITQLAQTYSVSIPEILLMFTLFLYFFTSF